LIAATVDLLTRFADPVLVSASGTTAGESFRFLGKRLVADETPGLGPLSGLVAALEASPHDLCLVVACDMPFLSGPLLEHLVEVAVRSPSAQVVVPRTERLHPLHAVYRRSVIPVLRERLARRELAVHAALAAVTTVEVLESELRSYDPGLRSLENVNTPEDLARAVGSAAALAALLAVRADP
jgi:molybdopterin-guanine dinucleotide biosynthesis protein A